MDERAEIVALDKRRVWHPYTPMQKYMEQIDPLVIAKAEGARLWDWSGQSYIDGNSSWWVASLGHRHPRLMKVLREQSDKLCHTSLAGVTHEPAARLAEELIVAGPPGMSRVFYGDNGSTAVEAALKMALQFEHNRGRFKKRRFVSLEGAFHGETIGAASLGGVEVFRRPFLSVLMDCILVLPPVEGGPDGYLIAFEQLTKVLRESHEEIAAVFLEPMVQGAAGMRMYPAAYLQHARALCAELDVLLIVDEVFTGYGRTGPMWACEYAGIAPDIVCIGKGFSGGVLPMAATLVTERIFEGFLGAPERAFWYGHSYCGNPLGAAIAREVLAIYREERILEQAVPKILCIAEAFRAMGDVKGVLRTRSMGMIGALDLADSGYLGQAGWRVYEEAKRRGVYLRPLGDVVYVAPPLSISEGELNQLLGVMRESVIAALSRA